MYTSFDKKASLSFLRSVKHKLVESHFEDFSESDDKEYSLLFERYPIKGRLKDHLKENSVNYWDYTDKKCRYHRKETTKGSKIARKILNKNLGSSYKDILQTIKEDKLRYFEKQSALEILEEVLIGKNLEFIFNQDGLLEMKEKQFTTLSEFNPYRFKSFVSLKALSEEEVLIQQNFKNFVKYLEKSKYTVSISPQDCVFKGLGIKGYVCIDHSITSYYGLVFAEYGEFFDKVSRCSLVFEIPSSNLGAISALKELEFLGTKTAKKLLIEDAYFPKHVKEIEWWSR